MSYWPEVIASLLTSQILSVVAMSCAGFLVSQVKPSPIGTDLDVGGEPVGQLLLAGLPLPLDVLDHEDLEPAAQGAEGQSERGGGLALAVAGVDDDQAVPALRVGRGGSGVSSVMGVWSCTSGR